MDIEFNDMFDREKDRGKKFGIDINSFYERIKDNAGIEAQEPKINTYNRLKFFVEVDSLPDLSLETSFWLDFRLTDRGVDVYTNPIGYKSSESGLRKMCESFSKDGAYWKYDFILNTLPEQPKLFS